jgi:hypothetical protein
MKPLSSHLLAVLVGLLLVAVAAPALIKLSHALLPLVIALAVALIAVRLVFFHTRGW